MGRLITTIILLGLAVFVFMVPTRAQLDKARPIEKERDDYVSAVNSAQEIKAKREALEVIKSNFSQEDEARLDKFLPDHIDNVRLIIEIKKIVDQKPRLLLEDIRVSDTSDDLAAALSSVGFSSTGLSFSVRGDYFAFKDLLVDLERNLRIVDVSDLSISYDGVTGDYSFSVSLRTYWIGGSQNDV